MPVESYLISISAQVRFVDIFVYALLDSSPEPRLLKIVARSLDKLVQSVFLGQLLNTLAVGVQNG